MPHPAAKLALISALLFAPALRPQDSLGNPTRDLSGVVTDPQHEPLRGAIVQLQAGDTPNITSYITGDDGRYRFLRLNGSSDYRVWVKFRNRTSRPRSISKFDSNMHKVIDFTMETF